MLCIDGLSDSRPRTCQPHLPNPPGSLILFPYRKKIEGFNTFQLLKKDFISSGCVSNVIKSCKICTH